MFFFKFHLSLRCIFDFKFWGLVRFRNVMSVCSRDLRFISLWDSPLSLRTCGPLAFRVVHYPQESEESECCSYVLQHSVTGVWDSERQYHRNNCLVITNEDCDFHLVPEWGFSKDQLKGRQLLLTFQLNTLVVFRAKVAWRLMYPYSPEDD